MHMHMHMHMLMHMLMLMFMNMPHIHAHAHVHDMHMLMGARCLDCSASFEVATARVSSPARHGGDFITLLARWVGWEA